MEIFSRIIGTLSAAAMLLAFPLLGADGDAAGLHTSVMVARDFDPASAELVDGVDPRFSESPGSVLLKGRLKFSGSPADGIGSFRIDSASGKPLSFYILKDSVFSEFGGAEVDSADGFFLISTEELAKGAPRLLWGGGVKGDSILVDKIVLFKDSAPSYRTFVLEKASDGIDKVANFATIEVVVDDYAKSYHYWYLAPMALLFLLLLLRKSLGLWMPSHNP